MRRGVGWVVIAWLGLGAAACGGRLDGDGGSDSGASSGGAGTGGSSAGSGATGTGATNGCEVDRHCTLITADCCPLCEPADANAVIAIPFNASDTVTCSDVPCVECPPVSHVESTSQYLRSVCDNGQCAVEDIRETELTTCTQDADCVVRGPRPCCKDCSDRPPDAVNLNGYVAVNQEAAASPDFCEGDVRTCSGCGMELVVVPPIPSGLVARCDAGRCVLDSECPPTPPQSAECPREDLVCEYPTCCGGLLAVQCHEDRAYWTPLETTVFSSCNECTAASAGNACEPACDAELPLCVVDNCLGMPSVLECRVETWEMVADYCSM